MTPTEQDKELADTIFQYLDGLSAVVSINHTTNRKGYAERRKRDDFIVYKTRDELLQLIAAYMKRVALEVRLDELIWSTGVTYKYEKGRQIIQDRIAELKTKQEEV